MENFAFARFLPALLVAFLAVNFSFAQSNGQIDFIKNDIETAKNRAFLSEKPILLKFSARWCLPCRVMEETVWPNPDLVEMVEKNFVPFAVDVQSFEGFALKDRYSVQVLPTILVTDATGLELFRRESSCGSAQMMDWLENYRQTKVPVAVAEIDFIWVNPQEFLGSQAEIEPVVFSTKTMVSTPVFQEEKMALTVIEGWPAH